MFDFMIIGQGIAGSVLALSLIKEGYSVCVIDKPDLSSCSRVAAGIWNPVVFKRLTKSWLADDVLPELVKFYNHFESEFNTTLIQSRTIIKPFTEEQEKILWLKKAETGNEFLDKKTYENYTLTPSLNIVQYSLVHQAGNLEVVKFLELTKQYIIAKQSYFEDTFDYKQLEDYKTFYTYKSISAKQLVFCEGHLISQNPYFNWIPLKPAKGETLTINCKNLNLGNSMINKGVYILPLGNYTFKIGATYEWDDLSDTPTEKGKEQLIQKITSLFKEPFDIIHHDAGIRPSVIDRRPVIGNHPELKNMSIFNGFGTKAVMLAPYFAKEFINHYKNDIPLNSEVKPLRFYKNNDS